MSKKLKNELTRGSRKGPPFIINSNPDKKTEYASASTDPASVKRKEAMDRYEEECEQKRLAEENNWF